MKDYKLAMRAKIGFFKGNSSRNKMSLLNRIRWTLVISSQTIVTSVLRYLATLDRTTPDRVWAIKTLLREWFVTMSVPTWLTITFGASTSAKTFTNHRAKSLHKTEMSHSKIKTLNSRPKLLKVKKIKEVNFIIGMSLRTQNKKLCSREIFTKQTLISGSKSSRRQIKSVERTKSIKKRESEVVASHL